MKDLFHLSLCLQSFSSLLFHRALVMAGRDCFSYLFPDALYRLAVTVGRSLTQIHLYICTHTVFPVTVGSMQKFHFDRVLIDKHPLPPVHNEVCLVNRNGRTIRAKRSSSTQQTLDFLMLYLKTPRCVSQIYFLLVCHSVCEREFGRLIRSLDIAQLCKSMLCNIAT